MVASGSTNPHPPVNQHPPIKQRSGKERSNEARGHAPQRGQLQQQPIVLADDVPAAGAHAAHHLINWDATPGAGVLPAESFGREVDGAAG